jgi:hypothetical protein
MKELVIIERPDIVSIADSVRNKTGQNKELTIGEMIDCINNMGSGGIDTSDATATSNDILVGETAYVNGKKIEGTFSLDSEITTQDEKLVAQNNLITSVMTALEGKAAGGKKNTKTIYLDWSQDDEMIGNCIYLSADGQWIYVENMHNIDSIEAEHGIVFTSRMNNYTDGFIIFAATNTSGSAFDINGLAFDIGLMATQDGETIYFVSSMEQQ